MTDLGRRLLQLKMLQSDLDVDVVMVEMTGADGYLHFELPVAPQPVETGPTEELIPHTAANR